MQASRSSSLFSKFVRRPPISPLIISSSSSFKSVMPPDGSDRMG
jgi:hypothetical protein